MNTPHFPDWLATALGTLCYIVFFAVIVMAFCI